MLKTLTTIMLTLWGASETIQHSVELDDRIVFGASVENMTAVFSDVCTEFTRRDLDPEQLPIAKHSHVQVDCQNFQHRGKGRLAEFVFADGNLVFIWILTEAEEHDKHAEALRAAYGTPTHETESLTAFADHNVALRRDIPEFLYYSPEIAGMYRGWFDSMTKGQ